MAQSLLRRHSRRQILSSAAALALAPSGSAWAQSAAPERAVARLAGGPTAGPELELAAGGLADGVARQAVAISARHGHRALLVWHAGDLVLEDYGPGVTASDGLPAFSMAKSVLGLMTGVALEAGAIRSIDDPVGRHLGEWSGDSRGEITLRQLLQMRSGLKLYSLAAGEPQAMEMAVGSRVSETALATPLERTPGGQFQYANVNSQILGMALDAAFRRSGLGGYAEVLQSRLWGPLGQGAAILELERTGGQPRYFAGLEARARDWLRLGRLFADGGRVGSRQVVPEAWLGAMSEPSPHPVYGLHLWRGAPWTPRRAYGPGDGPTALCDDPYDAGDMIFFDGAGGQRVYISRERRLVIVRLGAPSWAWEDSALPNLVTRNLIDAKAPSRE